MQNWGGHEKEALNNYPLKQWHCWLLLHMERYPMYARFEPFLVLQTSALFLCVVVVGVAVAAPQGGGYSYQAPSAPSRLGGGGQYSGGPSAPAQYNFQWDVNDSPSGNFFGHQEQRDGANTQGRSVCPYFPS